jgi:predicted acylesterase/phospholipase RssA
MSNAETVDVKAAKEILEGRSADLQEIFAIAKQLKMEKQFSLARNLLSRAAREILRGQSLEPALMLKLAKELKASKEFGLARRLLARARLEPSLSNNPRLRLEVYQQAAVCTYKDPDLQADARLDRALEILSQSCEDINTTTDQETLGITAAIYKRKWEVDNQKNHLERSLNYYLRGHVQGVAGDQGYNGINAAYIIDLLAHQEEQEADKAGVPKESSERNRIQERRAQAKKIREDIVREVPPLLNVPGNGWLHGKWWFFATVAEAYFGMGYYDVNNYEKAVKWLRDGEADAESNGTPVAPWEKESTARQFSTLARMQDNAAAAMGTAPAQTSPNTNTPPAAIKPRPALVALQSFFGKSAGENAYEGKIGLGLSGGGFRAALFHIGVLARLAELDILRRVEVLSCVSGGSIIGAHYYLEVRKLLQSKSDEEVTREDYLRIVDTLRRDFLAGVQRNIRTRVALNPFQTIKMIFTSKYSRTMRAGDLYEREIFFRGRSDEERESRWLNRLFICPVTADGKPDDNFDFKSDNWARRAKVPNLILNTTALNTGHNWQFTASWMGEPPATIDDQIDGNDRLRRLYYHGDDTPKRYKQLRLGHAVAASACVPGLFEALPLTGLYDDRIVRLVDGGVCDNQGVESLLEQDCNIILISDGSGQMQSENQPSNGLLGVPLRSNTILQARVREAQYADLSARQRASLLRGFMFVHLKDDLDVDPIDWIGCLDPYDASDDSRPPYRRGPITRYGIAKEIQELLAGVRTDLDSFSDLEAFALMTSAYRMTEHEFRYSKCLETFRQAGNVTPEQWEFLKVETGMKGSGAKYDYLKKQLSVSHMMAFKIWKLSPLLTIVSWLLGLGAVSFAVWACFHWAAKVIVHPITLWDIGAFIATSVAFSVLTYLIGKKLMRIVRLRETLIRIAIGIAIAFLGWFAAFIHLYVFDPLFLRHGSLTAFKKQQ